MFVRSMLCRIDVSTVLVHCFPLKTHRSWGHGLWLRSSFNVGLVLIFGCIVSPIRVELSPWDTCWFIID